MIISIKNDRGHCKVTNIDDHSQEVIVFNNLSPMPADIHAQPLLCRRVRLHGVGLALKAVQYRDYMKKLKGKSLTAALQPDGSVDVFHNGVSLSRHLLKEGIVYEQSSAPRDEAAPPNIDPPVGANRPSPLLLHRELNTPLLVPPRRATTVADMKPYRAPAPGTSHVGMVTAAFSVDHFYVVFQPAFALIHRIGESLNRYAGAQSRTTALAVTCSQYRVGDVCVAEFSAGAGRRYRSVITAVISNLGDGFTGSVCYNLRSLDYGYVELGVRASDLRRVPADLIGYEMLAVRASLSGARWIGGAFDRSYIPHDTPMQVRVVAASGHGDEVQIDVELSAVGKQTAETVFGNLLSRRLIDDGVRATPAKGIAAPPASRLTPAPIQGEPVLKDYSITVESLTVIPLPAAYLPRFTGQVTWSRGRYATVQVLQENSAHVRMLRSLLVATATAPFTPGYRAAVGEIVMAKFDGHSARAEVVDKVVGDDIYEVLFVDYGNRETVRELSALPEVADVNMPILGMNFEMVEHPDHPVPKTFDVVEFTVVDAHARPPLLSLYSETAPFVNGTSGEETTTEITTPVVYQEDDGSSYDSCTSSEHEDNGQVAPSPLNSIDVGGYVTAYLRDVPTFDMAEYSRDKTNLTCFITHANSGEDFYLTVSLTAHEREVNERSFNGVVIL